MQMWESRRPRDAEQAVYADAAVTWPSVGTLVGIQTYPEGQEKGVVLLK